MPAEKSVKTQVSNIGSAQEVKQIQTTDASKEPKRDIVKTSIRLQNQDLFERLKFLRLELSKKSGKRAFEVFSDATLLDMISKMPKNKKEMLAVKGVGDVKFTQYGEDFLRSISNRESGLNPNQLVLLQRLKSLRMDLARQINKPAFVIFSDATLLDMVSKMPLNKSEMLEVHGIGNTKLDLYGEKFLKVLFDERHETKIKISMPNVLEGIAHHNYLIQNIQACQSSLIIMSGWITSYVVDDTFLKLIEKKLQQGVKVYVGYGFQDYRGHHKEIGGSKEVLLSLKKIMTAYRNQLFIANYATHEKLLLIDSKTVVIGSANWLSNKNYMNSERSLIIQNSEFAKKEFDRATHLIMKNLIQ